MSERQILRLSVGELVAFSCRTGDLIADTPSGPTALEGIRAHQKLQKKRPPGSEAEYRLEVEYPFLGETIVLSGRVDIVHPQSDLHRPAQLDEIKTTYCHPEQLADSVRELHWAQLKIYGFCYLLQRQEGTGAAPDRADCLRLQMQWYNLKQKKSHPELREFAWPELEDFAHKALRSYLEWHRAWQQQRNSVRTSAHALEFPFPNFRPGQRELAISAYRCLRDGGELVAEAPTGIGKTVSTLFPAIKALGENHLDQLVYLTAKNSGRQVVRETATRLHEQGLKLSLLEIQAKDKTCACRLGLCSPDADGICPRTRGFFDRLPEARQQLLGQPLLTPEKVAAVADALQLCPFELSLQMLPWVDLVVCDFNYVFDPLVRLNSLQSDQQRRALLVDEAHNLGDRARGMYSAQLSRRGSRQAAKDCRGYPALKRAINALVRALDQWVDERPRDERFHPGPADAAAEAWLTPMDTKTTSDANHGPDAVITAAHKIMAVVSQMWEQSQSPPEEIGEWLNGLYRFLTIVGLLNDQHRCLTRRENRDAPWQEQQLKLMCISAADFLQQCFRQFHGVILFSATLRPAPYIQRQLGVAAEAPYLSLPSPFASNQLGVFLCPYLDTRYRARESAADALVELIARVYHSRPGNYLVFFPSYRFLQQVAERFAAQHPAIDLIQQTAGASEQERAAFLDRFSDNRRSLGFAIMGGIFGEGIDYVGEQLVGCILAGVGLPQVSEEQELLRQAAATGGDKVFSNGFDIAYRYPGLTRVLQAAGRVIRTETDRGVVILADARFADPFYRPLFPQHWQLQHCANGEVLSTALGNFWDTQK
ncbi:ATP-dependent DNA helicase [Microbulbifer pacificus]|uniref:ATP-dependent DNA helicase n=1 Tax=Microbulbifer pacificus TaxID=407164 RepID=A0AAU0MYJ5_9GAMM|nr:ATP-dependent DNA helicase [Microbulbifer pacificus]WOX05588.1 ATP-dependent DNA helicase [Microbulbifer pacificus]